MTDYTQRLQESFERLGGTPAQAAVAAAGRRPARPSGFDGFMQTGRVLGLGEAGARAFAIGRDVSEASARRRADAAPRPGPIGPTTSATPADLVRQIDVLSEAVARSSDADWQRPAGEARGATVRRASPRPSTRKPAKKSPAPRTSGRPQRVELYESSGRITPESAAKLRACLAESDSVRDCVAKHGS